MPVYSLKPGMILAKEVLCNNGFRLLNTGMELKEKYIRNLIKLGIPAVYIDDNLIPDIIIEDVIADETRLEAQNLVRNILENAGKKSEINSSNLLFLTKQATRALDDIIVQLMNNPNLIVNLADIRTADNYTFSHCVNVAVLSIATGISMGYSYADLKRIGLGTLLHDLGKTKIPIYILNKPGKLTDDEYENIKKHPQLGYEIAKKKEFMYISSALIIQQHHERNNGKGYPNGLDGNEIHRYAKVAAVADVYDALVADRPYRAALQPHKALEIIESNENEFDLPVLQNFVKHVAAYPIGTVVSLSNGLIGVVVHNTAGFPTRPKLRILCDKEYCLTDVCEIDLVKTNNIVVKKVFTENEIPEQLLGISASLV
jgi:putative nucleotidyltransferase with HDIG domain